MEYSSDGWLYPSLSILKELQDSKAISYSMLDKCEIREIIVGESSEFEVKQFVDWTTTMHDRDDVSLPCSGLSLTIQTVDISLRDIYRIAGLIPLDAPRKILSCELETDQRDDSPEDTWKKLPTKKLVGNGVTWAAVISINLGTAGRPWLSTVQVQDGIREIKKDLMIIEDVYGILTGISFKMKFVELEVLAHIAGWHMRGFSLTCMSVQVQGTILNRCVDNADGKWGQLWEYVSRSMKIYALGNLRVGYSAMIVLLGIIIRDLFLDPDVFCKQMRLYQYQATRWVCELLLASCKFMEVNEELLHMTATRGDLICAISRISETGEFSRTTPQLGAWFKCYYDTLRLMYSQVLSDDAPRIPNIDKELEEKFWVQDKVESSKLASIANEPEERKARVAWFTDAKKNLKMLDRGWLLHHLPQLESRKSSKREQSRSKSCSRGESVRIIRKISNDLIPVRESSPVIGPSLSSGLVAPHIIGSLTVEHSSAEVQAGSLARQAGSPVRKVIDRQPPENDVFSGDDSDAATTVFEDFYTERGLELLMDIDDNDILSDDPVESVPTKEVAVTTVPVLNPPSSRFPNVVFSKGGKMRACSVDEFFPRKKLAINAAEDVASLVVTPKDVLES